MQTSNYLEALNREPELQVMVYDSAVRRLVMTPPGDPCDEEALFQATGVRFQGDRFVLAELEDDPTCPPKPPEDTAQVSYVQRYQNLRDTVLSVLTQTHRALVCNQNGRMLCVLNWQDSPTNWQVGFARTMEALNEALLARHGFRFQCVVSQMLTGLDRLHQGRQQLEEAHNYRVLMGGLPGETVFYDGILRTVNRTEGSHSVLDGQTQDRALLQALLRGDTDRGKEIFHTILDDNFISSRPAVKFVQLRIFSVIDNFLKCLNQAALELGFSQEFHALNGPPRLLDAKGIWELETAAGEILDEYRALYEARRTTASLPYRIQNYIRDNYTDQDLNVNLVAAHFQVTPTYATRVFKQAFGTGIMDCIQQVRLTAAKSLLDSGQTVKTAASETGFSSSSALIRTFKKWEGRTPTQASGSGPSAADSREEDTKPL